MGFNVLFYYFGTVVGLFWNMAMIAFNYCFPTSDFYHLKNEHCRTIYYWLGSIHNALYFLCMMKWYFSNKCCAYVMLYAISILLSIGAGCLHIIIAGIEPMFHLAFAIVTWLGMIWYGASMVMPLAKCDKKCCKKDCK